MGKPKLQLKGQIFTYLTVIEEAGSKNGRFLWKCLCKCGKEIIVDGSSLKSNHTKSCGCYSIETATKHGLRHTRIYKIWNSLLQRCLNPKNTHYKYYGGRGIKVDKNWLSFENFYADMKEGYADNLTIERSDNNKDYNKSNCKWATMHEQSRNKRNTVWLQTPWGKLSIIEAAEKANLSVKVLSSRLYRNWSEDRLFLPVKPRNHNK